MISCGMRQILLMHPLSKPRATSDTHGEVRNALALLSALRQVHGAQRTVHGRPEVCAPQILQAAIECEVLAGGQQIPQQIILQECTLPQQSCNTELDIGQADITHSTGSSRVYAHYSYAAKYNVGLPIPRASCGTSFRIPPSILRVLKLKARRAR